MEDDCDNLSTGDPGLSQEGEMNGNPEMEDKEKTNGTTCEETQAGRWEIIECSTDQTSPHSSFLKIKK